MAKINVSVVREISFEINEESNDPKVIKGLGFIASHNYCEEHLLPLEIQECIKAAFDWVYEMEPNATCHEDNYHIGDVLIVGEEKA